MVAFFLHGFPASPDIYHGTNFDYFFLNSLIRT